MLLENVIAMVCFEIKKAVEKLAIHSKPEDEKYSEASQKVEPKEGR